MDQAELLRRLTEDQKAVEFARDQRATWDESEARDTEALRRSVEARGALTKYGLFVKREKVSMSSVGYVDQSSRPDERCELCLMFLAPPGGKVLGSCTLVEGDVNRGGWCEEFEPARRK